MESTPPDTPLAEGDHAGESDREGQNKSKKRRRAGLEASHLHGAVPVPEHIGSVLISAAETGSEKKVANSGAEKQAKEAVETERSIETLDRAELLELSEKIKINSSTLRQIYETNLIGEHGLRRLVAEYIHAGDLRAALRHEIVEHEIDFERDPQMRDVSPAQSPGDDSTDDRGKAALDELLKRVTADTDENGEDTRLKKQKSESAKAQIVQESEAASGQQLRRRIMNISLIGLIVILVALVVALYVKKG